MLLWHLKVPNELKVLHTNRSTGVNGERWV